MDFTNMSISAIVSGKTADGTSYLQLFLSEYRKIFGGTVNPSCNKCLTSYLEKYQKHYKMKDNKNTSGYRLKAKYENMPLEFGSAIFVNNDNITEEYAKIILKQKNGDTFFEKMPESKQTEKPKKDTKNINVPGQTTVITEQDRKNTPNPEKDEE